MILIHRILAPVALAVLLLPGAPRAGEPVVVELFTSQGCSSCPEADAFLGELATRDDVIALALHVPYWDYLGWRDTFAQPEFARRQGEYREAQGASVVYTPQMVVQGLHAVPGHKRQAVEQAIADEAAAPARARIEIVEHGGMLSAIGSAGPVDGEVWVARYRRSAEVAVERGENAGRNFVYRNVVTSLDRMGPGSAIVDGVTLPQPDPGEGIAVWVSEKSGGPILAAARYEPQALAGRP